MKTVADLAQHVADRFVQGHEQANEEKKHGAVDWAVLVELVGQIALMLLENCPMNSTDETVHAAVTQPNLRQRIMFRSHVARQCEGCAGHQFTRIQGELAECFMDCCKELSVEQVRDIRSDAGNPDYIMI